MIDGQRMWKKHRPWLRCLIVEQLPILSGVMKLTLTYSKMR